MPHVSYRPFPIHDWLVVVLLAFAGTAVLNAQQQPAPPDGGGLDLPLPVRQLPDGAHFGPEEEREYWEETVARALTRLESENAGVRRSAVMLLGKYPVPEARDAVVRSLEDPDPGVRLAALVSLFETRRIYTGETARKIVERVGDPDVGIRRIASNVLPSVLFGFPTAIDPETRRPVRQLPSELRELLHGAFRDEDVTVRRNMVAQYNQLMLQISERMLAELLRDDDREVAIEALYVAGRHFDADFLARQATELVDNPDRLFRLALARQLANVSGSGAEDALAALRADEDPEVGLEATLALFQQRLDPALYAELYAGLEENGRLTDLAQRAVRALRPLDEGAAPFLNQWVDHENPRLRDEAAQIYFFQLREQVTGDVVKKLILDESSAVRGRAMQHLRRHPSEITGEVLSAAAASRHPDVRRMAVELTRFVPEDAGEDVLMEFLLDDDRRVRAEALDEIAAREVDGWEEIMSLSLRDRDQLIRETAVRNLMARTTPETLDRLWRFLEDNPDTQYREMIEAHLTRHERPET